jgi:nicotinic acid mononucleotide adenylyltransferase
MVLYPVAVVLQYDTTHKITHITQNNTPHSKKHSTQYYTNNKGHILHTLNTITIQIQSHKVRTFITGKMACGIGCDRDTAPVSS